MRQQAPQFNETEVVAKAQSGDGTAFETIYNFYRKRTYNLCFRMVHDSVLAEDLMQDAFLQLLRTIKQFRGQSTFSTWLYRLVFNVVLMHLRPKRLKTSSIDEVVETEDEVMHQQFGKVDMALMMSPERIVFLAAFNLLPEACQTVYSLHDIEGYEYPEIARFLGCSKTKSRELGVQAQQSLLLMLNPKRGISEYKKILSNNHLRQAFVVRRPWRRRSATVLG